jgi:hypothetical protein
MPESAPMAEQRVRDSVLPHQRMPTNQERT